MVRGKQLNPTFEGMLASAGIIGALARLTYALILFVFIYGFFFSSHNKPMIWLVRRLTNFVLVIAVLMTLGLSVQAQSPVAHIRRTINGRPVILTVKRTTAERLNRHHATQADRRDLQEAIDFALGRAEIRKVSCVTGKPELPHEDLDRWVRCPAQNIRVK